MVKRTWGFRQTTRMTVVHGSHTVMRRSIWSSRQEAETAGRQEGGTRVHVHVHFAQPGRGTGAPLYSSRDRMFDPVPRE